MAILGPGLSEGRAKLHFKQAPYSSEAHSPGLPTLRYPPPQDWSPGRAEAGQGQGPFSYALHFVSPPPWASQFSSCLWVSHSGKK